ncbi:ATP-binding cassette, sub-B (MDR TAP), member 4 [Chytriomyces hyalinus]|nr:ATP-binding cassette, sub-B (MDR TAP), member 4 [Chytriomyces hyalinus]
MHQNPALYPQQDWSWLFGASGTVNQAAQQKQKENQLRKPQQPDHSHSLFQHVYPHHIQHQQTHPRLSLMLSPASTNGVPGTSNKKQRTVSFANSSEASSEADSMEDFLHFDDDDETPLADGDGTGFDFEQEMALDFDFAQFANALTLNSMGGLASFGSLGLMVPYGAENPANGVSSMTSVNSVNTVAMGAMTSMSSIGGMSNTGATLDLESVDLNLDDIVMFAESDGNDEDDDKIESKSKQSLQQLENLVHLARFATAAAAATPSAASMPIEPESSEATLFDIRKLNNDQQATNSKLHKTGNPYAIYSHHPLEKSTHSTASSIPRRRVNSGPAKTVEILKRKPAVPKSKYPAFPMQKQNDFFTSLGFVNMDDSPTPLFASVPASAEECNPQSESPIRYNAIENNHSLMPMLDMGRDEYDFQLDEPTDVDELKPGTVSNFFHQDDADFGTTPLFGDSSSFSTAHMGAGHARTGIDFFGGSLLDSTREIGFMSEMFPATYSDTTECRIGEEVMDASAMAAPSGVSIKPPRVKRQPKKKKEDVSAEPGVSLQSLKKAPTARKRATFTRDMPGSPQPSVQEHFDTSHRIKPKPAIRKLAAEDKATSSTTRKTLKEPVFCATCGLPVGILELRALPLILYAPRSTNLKCSACATAEGVRMLSATACIDTIENQTKPSNRKKKATEEQGPTINPNIHPCLACKRPTAYGTITVTSANPITTTTTNPSSSTIPDLAIAVTCNPCEARYQFCAECGGGGKTRTGKFRPRALFPATRRTCGLPHIRQGTSPVHTRVLPGSAVSKKQVLGMRDVLFDCLVGACAVPGCFEGVGEEESGGGCSGIFTGKQLEDVFEKVESVWKRRVVDVLAKSRFGGVEVLVTLAWIEKDYRMKIKTGASGAVGNKKGSPQVKEEGGVWFAKIGMDANGEDAAFHELMVKDEEDEESAENRTFVSFAVFEWNRAQKTLFISEMKPRSASQPSVESFRDIIRQTLHSLKEDVSNPTIDHIWCSTADSLHSRLKNVPSRLGFSLLDDYLKDHRSLGANFFGNEEKRETVWVVSAAQQHPTTSLLTTRKLSQSSLYTYRSANTVMPEPATTEAQLPNQTVGNNKKGKRDKKPKEPTVSILGLFRFADAADKTMIGFAMVFSMGIGALIPCAILILGDILGGSAAIAMGSAADRPIDPSPLYPTILNFVYFGISMLIAGYASQALWVLSGENQSRRIREGYMRAILRQDMSWFDLAEEGSLTTRLAQDTQLIQEGISEKFGLVVQNIAQFCTGFVIAFVKGPTLALVLLAAIPLMAGVGVVMFSLLAKQTQAGQDAYAEAGAVAEQVISGIRTIYSFSLQARFIAKYDKKLEKAEKADRYGGITRGVGFGSFMLVMFFTYGLAFWYGSKLVQQGKMPGQDVLVTFFALMMGSFGLMGIPSNLAAVGSARGAAFKIFGTISRVPSIDSQSPEGEKLDSLSGKIEFKAVSFHYPTRVETKIFNGFCFTIEPGKTVAFVGPSGSGKSSTVQLIQRFYDPISGVVSLDGKDLKSINVKWLRQQIGVVSQEPVLFNTSIKQNILMGAVDDPLRPVTEAEIHKACKLANCHNFIMKLPHGYDTQVGEHGGMLSGGQKQRIAIARAMIKNPKILLLDEATSALDTESERLVQTALDAASKDRTTIVIAHRLSTIKNADKIVVLAKGEIIEAGTHNELLALNGVYFQLVEKQKIRQQVESLLTSPKSHEALSDSPMKGDLPDGPEAGDDVVVIPEQTKSSDARHETRVEIEDRNAIAKNLGHKANQKKAEIEATMKAQKAPIGRVLQLMKKDWGLLIMGLIGAAGAGVIFPVFGLIFSTITVVLLDPTQIDPGPFKGANLYAFAFVVIGISAFIVYIIQFYGFEMAGAALTRRLRVMTFSALLRQEVGFFDEESNSLGALTSRLAVDAAKVGDLVTKVWADMAQLIVTGITGLTIGFVYSWQLTLIILLITPFSVISSYYESRVRKGFEDETKTAYEESGTIAAEAFKEIRTVAALTREGYFMEKFSANLEGPHQKALEKAKYASLGNGVSQAVSQFANALGFYAGLRLVEARIITFEPVFKVLMAVMFTASGLGRSSTFVETFTKAKLSAIKTFNLIDRFTSIDPEDADPKLDMAPDIDGGFEFKDVAFTYPARPTQPIFTGSFNLVGPVNKTIALVGPSGCGKSSAIGMLQRWYDATAGTVSIDGKGVKEYQLKKLRTHMALVGQEPTLFDMSIRENILSGSEKTDIPDSELDRVAKMANIYDIIMGMPDKYDTRVGDKGSQLSGGQKQRVAIARALIRNPRFLLLDEATSALDSESEKHVQQAIDNAINEGGRTTVTIAHRLSTIQNADYIAVVKDGVVAELGTHNELLGIKDGVYAALVKQQDLNALG